MMCSCISETLSGDAWSSVAPFVDLRTPCGVCLKIVGIIHLFSFAKPTWRLGVPHFRNTQYFDPKAHLDVWWQAEECQRMASEDQHSQMSRGQVSDRFFIPTAREVVSVVTSGLSSQFLLSHQWQALGEFLILGNLMKAHVWLGKSVEILYTWFFSENSSVHRARQRFCQTSFQASDGWAVRTAVLEDYFNGIIGNYMQWLRFISMES